MEARVKRAAGLGLGARGRSWFGRPRAVELCPASEWTWLQWPRGAQYAPEYRALLPPPQSIFKNKSRAGYVFQIADIFIFKANPS